MSDFTIVKIFQPRETPFNYYGISLKINEDIRYIATDENGEVYGFTSRPIGNSSYWSDGNPHRSLFLGIAYFKGEWSDSLVEVLAN